MADMTTSFTFGFLLSLIIFSVALVPSPLGSHIIGGVVTQIKGDRIIVDAKPYEGYFGPIGDTGVFDILLSDVDDLHLIAVGKRAAFSHERSAFGTVTGYDLFPTDVFGKPWGYRVIWFTE